MNRLFRWVQRLFLAVTLPGIFSLAAGGLLDFRPAGTGNFPPGRTVFPVSTFHHEGGPLTIALEFQPALPHTWLLLDGNLLLIRDASGDEVLKLDLVRRGRFRLQSGGMTRISWPLLDEIGHFPLRLIWGNDGIRLEMEGRTWVQLDSGDLPPGEYSIALAQTVSGIPGAFGHYRQLTVSAGEPATPVRLPDFPERGPEFARLAEVDRRLLADPAFDFPLTVPPAEFNRDEAGRAAIRIALDSLWKRIHIGRRENFGVYLDALEEEAARLAAPHEPEPSIPLESAGFERFFSPDDRGFHFGFIGWELGNYAPELARLGCDLVSDSVWPAQLMFPDGTFNAAHYRSRTLPSLRRLGFYGIGVDMLVAPYSPPFLLHKHPEWTGSYEEGRVAGHGFLSASIIHPDYRAMCRTYLDHLIPRLGGESNVVSICLDNEPGYEDYSPAMQARFRDFLRRRYGTVEEVNRSWGSSYADFPEITISRREAMDRTRKNRFYDWSLFCAEVGTAHLRELHETVRKSVALPTHVKVLPWEFGHTWIDSDSKERDEAEVPDGIDRLAISGFTDLIGTDAYADRYSREGTFAANTMYQSLYYDLVSGSDRGKALFDSEWHIAAIDARTPPEYLEMVMQQNVMHGLRAGSIWVMSPSVDRFDIASDVPLMIRYARTAALIRHFSGIYRALADRPRPIALLYSRKSRLLCGDQAMHSLQRLYEASLFSGLGIRVLDERQLESGGLDGVRALVAVDVPAVEEGTSQALRDFCRGGGLFVRIGAWGGDDIPGEIRHDRTDDPGRLREILSEAASRIGALPEIRVCGPDGLPVTGVEFHTVRQAPYGQLLFVANNSTAPQNLVIHGARRIRNLHTGESSGSRITLPVLGTLLAVVEEEMDAQGGR